MREFVLFQRATTLSVLKSDNSQYTNTYVMVILFSSHDLILLTLLYALVIKLNTSLLIVKIDM